MWMNYVTDRPSLTPQQALAEIDAALVWLRRREAGDPGGDNGDQPTPLIRQHRTEGLANHQRRDEDAAVERT